MTTVESVMACEHQGKALTFWPVYFTLEGLMALADS